DEHDGVIRVERLPVPRAGASGGDDLLGEHVPTAALAGSLDLHTRSSWGTRPRCSSNSHSRSATANGSAGLTYQASAPDHDASHASCVRSSNTTIPPRNGSASSRCDRARA